MEETIQILTSKRSTRITLMLFTFSIMLLLSSTIQLNAGTKITFSGEGFAQFGRIEHSSDTASLNYNGNYMHQGGAQLVMHAKLSEPLNVSIGIGMLEKHGLANHSEEGRAVPVVNPFIVEANFGYSFWEIENQKFKLSGGYLSYSYNTEVKNFGLYLLRGPVYPGIIISGFETKNVLPLANLLGFQLHHQSGKFEQDLLLGVETELFPLYDLSPAYLVNYKPSKVFRLGAGINLYHYISVESKLTSPTQLAENETDDKKTPVTDPSQRVLIYVDSGSGIRDTTFLSFKGTKMMANVSFDPKAFFSQPKIFGTEDLKIYSEVAIIGLDMSKAYKAIYGDYFHRMPIMFGFNFPAFKCLDHLSLEVEYYKARFRDDLQRFQPSSAVVPSPLPQINLANADLKRDDIKWSIHAEKTLDNVRLSFQVANDHSRPGGRLLNPAAEWQSLYTTPKDWYWIGKLAFFF